MKEEDVHRLEEDSPTTTRMRHTQIARINLSLD